MGRHPIVALLTDFGLQDHYVGVMKGVMLGICPSASIVDITHDVPAQDVLAGAFELAAAFSYFPQGTTFVAVVDPGVGSSRLAIAAEAGGYRFVGPDNGLFSLVFRR
ncbi:MAG: S-adenosyl-l-methionine hydroxide adenosyltransferase family protein, partial [Vicinamibacterales bacterium]